MIKKIFFSSAAIYVSGDFIDVAKAKFAFGGMKVTLLQRFPISKDAADPSSAYITPDLDKIFAKVFPTEEDKPYRIAMNVRNDHLILRRFTISNIPGSEVGQAVAFEAQKYIPSMIDNLSYGYKKYSRRQGSEEIIFAASETKNIHELTDYFSAKDILPSIIEPIPILMARALALTRNLKKNSAYIFIHYEPFDRVSLCEISHSYPYFFRELTIASEGEGAKSLESSYPTLRSVWPRIEKDVIGGMEYLRKETGENVEKIFISGFDPSPDEAAIAHEFGLPFKRPNLSFFKGIDAKTKDRCLPALMLLHDSQRGPSLNIAPEDIVKNDLWGVKNIALVSIAIFAVIILVHMFLGGVNARKKGAVAALRREFSNAYKGVNPASSKSEIASYNETTMKKSSLIYNLLTKRYHLTEKLLQLGEKLPGECWVDSFAYDNQIVEGQPEISLTMKGSIFGGTSDTTDPNKMLANIKQDKTIMNGFRDAELSSVSRKKMLNKEIAEFVITFK